MHYYIYVTFACTGCMCCSLSNISKVTNGGKVCVVGYKYHVTDEGVVDPSRYFALFVYLLF